MKSVDDILEEAKKREGKDAGRIAKYKRLSEAYFEDEDDQAGGNVRGMDASGRATLQEWGNIRNHLLQRKGAPNLIQAIVNDFVALRAPLPTMKVLPEASDDEAQKAAADRSRIVRAWWTNSNMDLQQVEAAWMFSCLGDFVYTLTKYSAKDAKDEGNAIRQPGVYISVVDPRKCYPRFRNGWDRYELDDLYIIERLDKDVAKSEYGYDGYDNTVLSVHYLSRTEVSQVVGDKMVSQVEHGLGFCPAEWVRARVLGSGKFAQSDVSGVLDQHEELQVMHLVMNDSLIEATYSQVVVRDPVNVSEQFVIGPGAPPIVVQGTGSVDRLQPSNPPTAAQMIINKTWENIQHTAGTAPVRTESSIQGSNISGRALNAVQGPMENRLATSQSILGASIQRVNAKAMLMAYNVPDLKTESMTIYGEEKGTPFAQEWKGEDFGGWFRTSVEYGAMIGTTTHEKVVVGLQLLGQKLVPKKWVLEQMGVDDPERLIEEAMSDFQKDMQMQAQMQGPPGGAPPGGPPGQGDPAAQGAALDAGATGGAASPPPSSNQPPPPGPPPESPQGGGGLSNFPPADSPPTQNGIGTPTPLPDLYSEIQQIKSALPPQVQEAILNIAPVPGGVQVTVSDWQAKAAIRKAFAPLGKVTVDVAKGAAKGG